MRAPVTPETLTDEMVRAAIDTFALAGMPWLVTDCFEALGPSDMFYEDQKPTPLEIGAARRRVCAAINARTKDSADA